MKCLGVDWASGIWVVAIYDDSPDAERRVRVEAQPSFLNVADSHDDADRILVDVPIALEKDRKDRAPDREARERLGKRSSTVFRVPTERAITAPTYEDAKEKNGGALGSHSWSLAFCIREVRTVILEIDELPEIYESHPEVCFHAFDERATEDSKDTDEGVESRLASLVQSRNQGRAYVTTFHRCEKRSRNGTAWKHRIGASRLDDVLDALAMARAAELAARNDGLDFLGATVSADSDILEKPSIAYFGRGNVQN